LANQQHNNTELFLCEKPSQGRDIARILGATQRFDGYLQGQNIIVSWCIGHLLEMQTPDAYNTKYKRWSIADLPIVPQQWKMQAKKSTRKQLLIIKKLLKLCPKVVIATDADREGETIAREVLDYYHYTGATRRLWLSALDSISIKRALAAIKPSTETEPLYYSGLARGQADWLIGMNLTRTFTLLANDKQVRSVGRVQTPTLALIVNRDRDILNFKPVPYYEVMAFFKTKGNELLETKWMFAEQIENQSSTYPKKTNETKHCLDKQLAQSVIERCHNQQGLVTTAMTHRKKQPPPLLYNLSGLQQEASRRWGYGAQEVLNLAQSLYETHKLTSYPRSDCEYLPMSQLGDVSQVLQALCQNDPGICNLITQSNQQQRSRVWNDKKISAHHAIIPTQATPGISRLNHKEYKLYNLIRRRYIAQFFPDYEYDQTTIIITIKSDQFKASGRISRVRGWKQVIDTEATTPVKRQANAKKELDNVQELPAVNKGESLLCSHLKLVDKLTKPPKSFTEGTLIKAMETIGTQVTNIVLKKILRETAGLGTQATRANIIQTLFQRKYINKEKKLIKATALGCNLIDTLPDTIKDPILTAQWEQQLDDIANSKGQNSSQLVADFIQQQISLLNTIITQIKSPQTQYKTRQQSSNQFNVGEPCPKCSHPLEIRKAIRGSKVGMDYIGCSHFPDCRFYFWPSK
jgi:DNA topoisomerase III